MKKTNRYEQYYKISTKYHEKLKKLVMAYAKDIAKITGNCEITELSMFDDIYLSTTIDGIEFQAGSFSIRFYSNDLTEDERNLSSFLFNRQYLAKNK